MTLSVVHLTAEKTNSYMHMIWQITSFKQSLLSHQTAHCFPLPVRTPLPCLMQFLSLQFCVVFTPSHWYVAINRGQFNLQVDHLATQNCMINNHWVTVIVCFVQLQLIFYLSQSLVCHFYFMQTHQNTLVPTYRGISSIISREKQGSARRGFSRCHVRSISPQITQRENYSDAFRCPLSRVLRVLLWAEGEAKWMWQA